VDWRPAPADLWRAVEAYLEVAWGGPPPPAVAERLARLRAAEPAHLLDSDVFERSGERLSLRLGNRSYPHMKLVIEPSSSGTAQFRADTHDRHFLELLGSPGPELTALIARNHEVAREIEAAWQARGLRTSADHWREELARWHAAHD
jgi:hypothetical protein